MNTNYTSNNCAAIILVHEKRIKKDNRDSILKWLMHTTFI
jgi:hypothetical protein